MARSPSAARQTFTANFSGGFTWPQIGVDEYFGVTRLDVHNSAWGNLGTDATPDAIVSPAITPTVGNTIVWAATASADGMSFGLDGTKAGTGWTRRLTTKVVGGYAPATEDKPQTVAASITATFTSPNDSANMDGWFTAIAALDMNPTAVTGSLNVAQASQTLTGAGSVSVALDVVLLCHFDNAPFVDVSTYAHTLTATSVTVSTPNPKFGAGCGYWVFGSANARIDTGSTSDFWFDDKPFTIEAWCFQNSTAVGDGYDPILAQWDAVLGNVGFFFTSLPHLMFFFSPDGTAYDYVDSASTPPMNAWNHVAVDRDASNVLRIYLNGAIVGAKAIGGSFFHSTYHALIGNDASLGRAFPGALDEVRVVRGVALYGGTFSPPTAPYLPPEPIGPTSVTGVLNVVQANQGLSASGGPTAGATLAIAQAPHSLVAAANTTVGGSLNLPQAPQTLSGAAGPVVKGLLACTQQDQTILASGALKVTGTLSANQQPQTLTGQGTAASPNCIGTLQLTQANQTINGHATVAGTVGALSVTQADQTLGALARVVVGGALNAAQAAQTLSGAARANIGGTLTATQADQTLAGQGGTNILAALNLTQGNQTLVGRIDTTGGAILDKLQDSQILVGAAKLTVGASLDLTQASQTLTGLLSIVAGGALRVTQDSQTFEALANLAIEARLVAYQQSQTLIAHDQPGTAIQTQARVMVMA